MLNKASQYQNIIVKTIPATGTVVYLKDIARVELGKFTFSSNAFVDGNRASTISVYQSPGSNALQTAQNIYAEMAKLKKSFPADVDYKVPFESVTIIQVSIHEVVGTLVKGISPGSTGSVPFPAKLAFNPYTYPGYPGLYPGYILLFYPPGLHYKHAYPVRFRISHRYCGG